MKHILFFVIAICFSIYLFGQAPVLEWAKQMGGKDNDYGISVAVDAAGNVYTTGWYRDTADFDPGSGFYNLISVGSSHYEVFVSKLDVNGNFIWAKSMGGPFLSGDFSNSIKVDEDGNVYTAGIFTGTADFDPSAGIYNLTSAGNADIFISKLDSNGSFIWAKNIGGTGDDGAACVAVDHIGNVYVTGKFEDLADFDPGPGVFNITSAGNNDIFVCKLDNNGSFIWAKNMGGIYSDLGGSMSVDSLENTYLTGNFQGTADFDPGTGIFNLISNGNVDIFISKLDANGNFVWAKNMGGLGFEGGSSIVYNHGNVYSTGTFYDTADFDPGTGIYNLTTAGNNDFYVSKLDDNGNFVWAKKMGGPGTDPGSSIEVDTYGNVFTTGYFNGTADFDPGTGTFNLTSAAQDVFISKLDASGNFLWAKNMGGPHPDYGHEITVDANGNIYIAGLFSNIAYFDPPASGNLISNGLGDIFVVKYSQTGVGIPENNSSNTFHLFPNPTNGLFTIQLHRQYDNVAVKMFNVTGQCVFNNIYHRTNTLNVSFDGGTGIYFVEVRNAEGETMRTKILKE